MNTAETIKQSLVAEATRLGFVYCGFAQAGLLEAEALDLERWLAEGRHGQMGYMETTFDTRIDARKLLPGAKTVISLLAGYSPPDDAPQPTGAPKIARYARGKDYHHVLRERTQALIQHLYALCGDVGADWFVDRSWKKPGRSAAAWAGSVKTPASSAPMLARISCWLRS
jgi:epoxyqueuosine reductase